MKNFIYLSIISLLFLSCSGDSESEAESPNPTVSSLISPANNKLCVSSTVNFEWKKSTDKNNDDISYLLEIAKDNQFTQIVESAEGTSTSRTIELEKNTAYYWRIKTLNSQVLLSSSPVNKFYTSANDAVENYLPFSPELTAPVLNSALSGTTASLQWNATDVDDDALRYDVYFGTANPPTVKINENYTQKTVDVTLQPAKEYFWKVVVKDGKGGETVGQTWKFKTN